MIVVFKTGRSPSRVEPIANLLAGDIGG